MTPNTGGAVRDRIDSQPGTTDAGPKPLLEKPDSRGALVGLWIFVTVPFVALVAAVPWAWGWGLSWTDVTIFAVLYPRTGLGITVGFHRYLTHGSFKATRWLRVVLAAA
jgi:stearoyl-CoA desaturase (delta-9 desaturase)